MVFVRSVAATAALLFCVAHETGGSPLTLGDLSIDTKKGLLKDGEYYTAGKMAKDSNDNSKDSSSDGKKDSSSGDSKDSSSGDSTDSSSGDSTDSSSGDSTDSSSDDSTDSSSGDSTDSSSGDSTDSEDDSSEGSNCGDCAVGVDPFTDILVECPASDKGKAKVKILMSDITATGDQVKYKLKKSAWSSWETVEKGYLDFSDEKLDLGKIYVDKDYKLIIYDEECKSACETTFCFTPTCGGAGGDPHLVGFKGQRFDFTGESEANYALLADEPSTLLTMQVHAPIPELPVITYITGVGLTAEDMDGNVHTVHVSVDDPSDVHAEHKCPTDEPCLAEGVLTVLLDGEPMTRPGAVELGPGFSVGGVNIPGECRPFGFEKYWAGKVRQAELAAAGGEGRRLLHTSMAEWILRDFAATNIDECMSYVERALLEGTLFEHDSEHVSFQIRTPELTIRLNHGKLHQLPMRDPTDQFDLPDHLTFQMNISIERAVLRDSPQGVLGGTVRPTFDATGGEIKMGIGAIVGTEEDYRVTGPFENDFILNHPGADTTAV